MNGIESCDQIEIKTENEQWFITSNNNHFISVSAFVLNVSSNIIILYCVYYVISSVFSLT